MLPGVHTSTRTFLGLLSQMRSVDKNELLEMNSKACRMPTQQRKYVICLTWLPLLNEKEKTKPLSALSEVIGKLPSTVHHGDTQN